MNEKLSTFHIALLIYMIELDVTMFSMPRLVAENIGTNGWLGVILLSFAAAVNIMLIQLVYRIGKGRSVFEIARHTLPRFVLYPVYILLALFWTALGSFICKKYVLIFQMLSFPTTNPMLLYGVIVLLMFYLLTKGIYNIGKVSTIFFLFTIGLIFFIFYYIPSWRVVRFTEYFFQGTSGGHGWVGWIEVYTIFVGFELALLLFPFTNKKSGLIKGIYAGHFIHLFTVLLLIFTCFGFFSFEQLKILMYPVINLLSFIELPFINRVENLIYTIFLFANLISLVMFTWAALMSLKQIFPAAKAGILELALAVLSFGFGCIPRIARESERLLILAYYAEIALSFTAPLALLLLLAWQSLFRRKGSMP